MSALSIVIPNARHFPHELVQQVAAQMESQDELILVKNRPRERHWVGIETAGGVENLAAPQEDQAPSQRLPYERVTILSSLPGAATARNAGWQSSKNEWVLFLDDDVSISSSFLSDIRANVVQKEKHGVTTFRVQSGSVAEWSAVSAIISLDRGAKGRRTDSVGSLALHETWQFGVGAAMLVHITVLQKTHGFKSALGAGLKNGGAEDLEFLWHASRHTTIEYYPNLLVHHRYPETLQEIGLKFRQYGRAIAKVAGTAKRREGFKTVANYCTYLLSTTFGSAGSARFPARVIFRIRVEVILAIGATARVYVWSLLSHRRSLLLCEDCRHQ